MLGLTEAASSFFLMGDTADSGPILSQTPIPITDQDTASSLYAKVQAVIHAQIADITRGLRQGSLQPRQQDASRASYWRKRTAADGQIDWRMSAETIYNLVRAISHPYPGAHFVYQGKVIKLWRCNVVDHANPNTEPGKVLESGQGVLLVKCREGALRLIEHGLDELPAVGAYL